MSQEIFNGVTGFSGFYNAFSGENVQITFARASANSDSIDIANGSNLDEGFLVQQYTAQWQRPLAMERVLNRTKPVAMMGSGQGTLQLTGLVGTRDGITSLLQADELCEPLVCIIRGAASFTDCNNKETQSGNELIIKLTNVISDMITITGSSQQAGLQLQSATARFQFGGFSIEGVDKK